MEYILEEAHKFIIRQVENMCSEWPEIVGLPHIDVEEALINYIATGCPYSHEDTD